ncbi:MAG: 2,3-diphosphoglycerate-dependent phosphoglycerate mutase [Lentimicrobiaceae bacterium]|nr:2,3-diphosphoglycerate-dependent phosphoglycerate mutase [Lentimicrobiaceae bacterium]
MKKLILIRHGESEWNKLNLFTGWTDVDLSPKGLEEAYEAGKLLKKENYKPELCFTSYLKRAVKTLNNVLDAMDMDWLPVEKSWRLNEKSYGAIQGLNKADTAAKYGDDQVLIWRRSFDVQPPALEMNDPKSPRMDERYAELTDEQIPLTESLKDTIERLMPYYNNVILKAFENHDQIMVVAHGNSLRGIVKELRQMTNDEIIKFNIPTAVPYVFEFDDEMNLQNHFFLGDQEEIRRKMESVANQGKAK